MPRSGKTKSKSNEVKMIPLRPLSPFQSFCEKYRKKIMSKHNCSELESYDILQDYWYEARQSTRDKFENISRKAMRLYLAAVKEYEETNGVNLDWKGRGDFELMEVDVSKGNENGGKSTAKGKKKQRDPNCPTKPCTMYIRFRKAYYDKVKEKYGPDQSEVNKRLTKLWAKFKEAKDDEDSRYYKVYHKLQKEIDQEQKEYQIKLKAYQKENGIEPKSSNKKKQPKPKKKPVKKKPVESDDELDFSDSDEEPAPKKKATKRAPTPEDSEEESDDEVLQTQKDESDESDFEEEEKEENNDSDGSEDSFEFMDE